MNRQEQLTPMEQSWGEMLQRHQVGHCLDASELIELAEAKGVIPTSSRLHQRQQHALFCPTCRTRLLELRRTEQARPAPHAFRWDPFAWLRRFRQSSTQSQAATPHATPDVTTASGFPTPSTPSLSPPQTPGGRFGGRFDPSPGAPVNTSQASDRSAAGRFGIAPQPAASHPAPVALKPPKRSPLLRPLLLGGVATVGLATLLLIGVMRGNQRLYQENSSSETGPHPSSPGNVNSQDPGASVSESPAVQIGNNEEGTHGSLSGTDQQVQLLSPTLETQSDAPPLVWASVRTATKYEVEVMENAADIDPSRPSSSLAKTTSDTSWQLPPHALTPGKSYTWTVKAYRDASLIAQATGHFKVIE
ncbi:MAG TPA: hypothetical protein VKU00_11095 [Chthonomonadaceae bacterium]|nr:hypothetical protein [Chthonomonadaceae bacterium]